MMPWELDHLIGTAVMWVFVIIFGLGGYACSRYIQNRRLAEYKDED